MDDLRGTLTGTRAVLACVALLGALGAEVARGAAPTPHEEARAALDAWRLTDADAILEQAPPGDERELLKGRLDVMRANMPAAVARLGPLVERVGGEAGYEARVWLGRALQALGRKSEAFTVLDRMAEDYNDDRVTSARGLMWLGVGLMLTDYPKNAHRVFREALDKDPQLTLAKRLWADLYASKYDYRKADPLYKAVGDDLMAQVGRARVAIESDRAFAEASELMTQALAKSPECVPCHNVLALVALHNERPEEAAERMETQSLRVAGDDLEALGLLGAAYYLMDDEAAFARVERRALAVNPKASAFYATVAEHAEREHRYVEAIALLEKALRLDPEDWNALGMLGTGYSRTGEDDKARETLDRAFDGDPFNVRIYNLLAHFYDKVDQRFVWIDVKPMRLRVDRAEAPVLERVLPPLLIEAEKALSKKYGVRPELPLHIEVFKDTETFAVRSTGLPGLAAHGICFGHVITARSPSNGDFNWAEVLWHELAHVYHIQMTHGRVPRWFTEGLAVLESLEARPAWEREQDRELAAARAAGKLRGVADFNLAFTQARSIGDILVAYYQAYYVTRFIRDEWGFARMRRMLELWGKKRPTAEVFEQALGVGLAEFDRRFFAWLDARLGYLRAAYPFDLTAYRALDPARVAAIEQAALADNGAAKAEAAMLALARGDEAKALALAEASLTLGGSDEARYARAVVRTRDAKARASAKADWEALRATGKAGVEGLGALAALATDAGDHALALTLWREAAALDPKNAALLGQWLGAAEKAKDADTALDVERRLLAVEQADARLAVRVIDALIAKKAGAADVLPIAEQAWHIAPFSIEVHLARARAFLALGRKEDARRAVELALLLDPNNAEAKALASP